MAYQRRVTSTLVDREELDDLYRSTITMLTEMMEAVLQRPDGPKLIHHKTSGEDVESSAPDGPQGTPGAEAGGRLGEDATGRWAANKVKVRAHHGPRGVKDRVQGNSGLH